jgi:hypothetical protein
MLDEHDGSEDSTAISRLLGQAYYLLHSRVPVNLPERPIDTESWATSLGHVNMYSVHTSEWSENNSGWSETSTDEEEDVNTTAASPSTPPLVEESLATSSNPDYMSIEQWLCYKCMNRGHFARDCTVGSEPSPIPANESYTSTMDSIIFVHLPTSSVINYLPSPKTVQCPLCSQMGHFAQHCNVEFERSVIQIPPVSEPVAVIPPSLGEASSSQPTIPSMDGVQCFNCMDFGHYARFCPMSTWSDEQRRLFPVFNMEN